MTLKRLPKHTRHRRHDASRRAAVSPRRGRLFLITLAGVLLLGPACSQNTDGVASSRRMTRSTGHFNQGYKDGMQHAEWSLFDANMAWSWLWIAEAEYQRGFEQGWKDGRTMVRLKEKQKEHEFR